MNYFRLFPFCSFVYTKTGGCIYDFSDGRMWTIDNDNCLMLQKAENNNRIVPNIFFDSLCKLNLGQYYDRKVWIDHRDYGANSSVHEITDSKTFIESLFIVYNECSLKCDFCDSKMNRSTGCKIHYADELLSTDDYFRIIDNVKLLGCNCIHHIGGDPIINKNKLNAIIEYSNASRLQQIVYTNGSRIDDSWIDYLSKNKVIVNFQFIFRDTKDAKKQLHLLQKLKESNVGLLATILVTSVNEEVLESVIATLKLLSIPFSLDTLVNPCNQRAKEWKKILGKGKQFTQHITAEGIALCKRFNTCLYGKMAILSDGIVIPCPMMDNYHVGNILKNQVQSILSSSKYTSIISMSKDKQDMCSECELKYGCTDCRAIEYNNSSRIEANDFCMKGSI